ncbi:nitrilase [Leucobacter sp. CSA2]|uniref:Nitrilase n=1 Tax=Leucobacter edaphi TaxID=2796472 RepID=A0A934UXP5_9MICO|nr:nitrilase-related carbon-nitrogen hydrolase [Leucobacter edaphi]MBK0421548.1 nitrilase [Leucobacter edaphi]
MRIALLQGEALPLDVDANLRAVAEAAGAAREHGAELLLTPELWVSGYAPRELAEWLTPERVASIPSDIAEMAADQGIAIAASFPFARSDGSYAIAAGLWDRRGAEVLRYEKVHLWGADEPLAFSPSAARPEVAEWNGRTVGFQICYDIEFPEPTRGLAERGADLILVPTAIDGFSDYVPAVTVRSRAAENALVVAYADHAAKRDRGDDPGETFAGLSTVAGREGIVLALAGREAELLLADIPDVAPVPAGQADYLSDRRPDLYSSWG